MATAPRTAMPHIAAEVTALVPEGPTGPIKSSQLNSEALVAGISKVIRRSGIRRETVFADPTSKNVYAYSIFPTDTTKIVRESADGSVTIGRFRNGAFRAVRTKNA